MEIADQNLQRRDLSPFGEADAMMSLLFEHGYCEMVARKLGKSRTTITETSRSRTSSRDS
jgi:hypothetical protein